MDTEIQQVLTVIILENQKAQYDVMCELGGIW
jgi:hypothetical protein